MPSVTSDPTSSTISPVVMLTTTAAAVSTITARNTTTTTTTTSKSDSFITTTTKSIWDAIHEGDIGMVKFWITEQKNTIDQITMHGDTPLIYAVRCGNRDIIKLLIEHGANTNVKNELSETLEIIAAQTGNQDISDDIQHQMSEDTNFWGNYIVQIIVRFEKMMERLVIALVDEELPSDFRLCTREAAADALVDLSRDLPEVEAHLKKELKNPIGFNLKFEIQKVLERINLEKNKNNDIESDSDSDSEDESKVEVEEVKDEKMDEQSIREKEKMMTEGEIRQEIKSIPNTVSTDIHTQQRENNIVHQIYLIGQSIKSEQNSDVLIKMLIKLLKTEQLSPKVERELISVLLKSVNIKHNADYISALIHRFNILKPQPEKLSNRIKTTKKEIEEFENKLSSPVKKKQAMQKTLETKKNQLNQLEEELKSKTASKVRTACALVKLGNVSELPFLIDFLRQVNCQNENEFEDDQDFIRLLKHIIKALGTLNPVTPEIAAILKETLYCKRHGYQLMKSVAEQLVKLSLEKSKDALLTIKEILHDTSEEMMPLQARQYIAVALASCKRLSSRVIEEVSRAVIYDMDSDLKQDAALQMGKMGSMLRIVLDSFRNTLLKRFDFSKEEFDDLGNVDEGIRRPLYLLWKGCIKKEEYWSLLYNNAFLTKDIHFIDKNGNSYLHWAAFFDRHQFIVIFRAQDQDTQEKLSAKNKFNQFPPDIAMQKNNFTFLGMILKLSASVISREKVVLTQDDQSRKKILGTGSYGVVYQGEMNNSPVAYKEFGKAKFTVFHREVNILYALRHANIVSLYAITVTPMGLGMVMELLEKGSLRGLLDAQKNQDTPAFEWSEKIVISQDIAKGLIYLHEERKIIHSDLKASNILIDQNNHAKLSDFGFAVFYSPNTHRKNDIAGGSIKWMAPEVLNDNSKKTFASDMYSFGTVLWELSTLRVPYDELDNSVASMQVLSYKTPELPPEMPPLWSQLIQDCWNSEPTKRPTAKTATEYLNKNTFRIIPSKSQNVAVLHFTGIDEAQQDQQDIKNMYSMQTFQYLLSVCENTAQIITYVADEERFQEVIENLVYLSKTVGKLGLAVFMYSSGECFGVIVAGKKIVMVDPMERAEDPSHKTIVQKLMGRRVLESCYISNTPLITYASVGSEILKAQCSVILFEWAKGVLVQPKAQIEIFLAKLAKTGEQKNENKIDIGFLSSTSIRILQSKPALTQFQFLREQHLTLLKTQPESAVARNEASSVKKYFKYSLHTKSAKMLKKMNKELKKEKSSPDEIISDMRHLLVSKQATGPFALSLKKFEVSLSQNLIDTVQIRRISSCNIVLHTPLGRGNFGDVYKIEYSRAVFAIKLLNQKNASSECQDQFRKESAMLADLQHPNIIRIYGICEDLPNYPFGLIMEFMEGGDAQKAAETGKLTVEKCEYIALDIARAISYLHEKGIIHNDLRASNILLDKNYQNARLADFGLAKKRIANMSLEMTNETTKGVVRWLSPEVLNGEMKTEKADVYSFGMILWELMTGKFPFNQIKSDDQARELIKKGEILSNNVLPDPKSVVLEKLMMQCLAVDPAMRPSMSDVIDTLHRHVNENEFNSVCSAKKSAQSSLSKSTLLSRNTGVVLESPKGNIGVYQEEVSEEQAFVFTSAKKSPGKNQASYEPFEQNNSASFTQDNPTHTYLNQPQNVSNNSSWQKSNFNQPQNFFPSPLALSKPASINYSQELTFKPFKKIILSDSEMLLKTQSLKNQAAKFGFVCVDIERNDNCFFNAVSHQLNNSKSAGDLRQLAADELSMNQKRYEEFVGGDYGAFYRTLSVPNKWADHLAIQALCDKLEINIVVIQDDNTLPVVFNSDTHSNLTIYIGYETGLQYYPLKLDESIVAAEDINQSVNNAVPISRLFTQSRAVFDFQ